LNLWLGIMESVFAWEIASIKSQIDQSTPLSCLVVAIERRSELEEVPSSMDSSWRKSDAPRKKWLTKAAVMARSVASLSWMLDPTNFQSHHNNVWRCRQQAGIFYSTRAILRFN
jgi:hypothetical protein